MATTEHTINDAIARILRTTRKLWRGDDVVVSENTGRIKNSTERPDILVMEQFTSPVCIETEILPANTVEIEAKSRLGKELLDKQLILSSIAVRLPVRLREYQGDELHKQLREADDIEMALHTNTARIPDEGWLIGGIADLSFLTQSASLPPELIDKATDILEEGVSQASIYLEQARKSHPAILELICNELHQENNHQTLRMAMTILANAFIFHNSLARTDGKLQTVPMLSEIQSSENGLNQTDILAYWRIILSVNYWSIFDIAHRVLRLIPMIYTDHLLQILTNTAHKLLQHRMMRSHDLMGAVFQRLIVDRQFLAAYYTTPASASLLVGLALRTDQMPSGKSWASADDLTSLRIADFACGTGTLLSTAYHRISQLHELAGGDSEMIHPQMMAKVLVGCDVLPSATHLTASMLSGAHPTVKYENSSILTVAYGEQENGAIALGSLDLLDPQGRLDFYAITAKALEGKGTSEQQTWLNYPDNSFDMVIMNPPFTRDTSHELKIENTPNPMFAAFGATPEKQRKMADRAKQLTKGTCAHGNAGEASMFLALADRKLKPDGILALVMPITIITGSSWEKSRQLLYKGYRDLIIVTVVGLSSKRMAFSADTGMGECLIIARKGANDTKRAIFVNLYESPTSSSVGISLAQEISDLIANHSIMRLEDLTPDESLIRFGKGLVGNVVNAPITNEGSWNLTRIADLSLAKLAYQMVTHKRFWLPRMNWQNIPHFAITTAGEIGKIGPYHLDVSKKNPNGSIRGPFKIMDLKPHRVPSYPILNSHHAPREYTMMFEPDSEGISYTGKDDQEQLSIIAKIEKVWATANH